MAHKYVIGINWEQNSTASLFKDGQVLGSLSEERISRTKNDERYPRQAIDYLLSHFGVAPEDIDAVCYVSQSWAPGYILTRHYTTFSIEDYIREQKLIWYPRLFEGNTSVSQIEVFADKLDLKQFPGEEYWSDVVQAYSGTSAHASDKDAIEHGVKIRKDVSSLHLGIDRSKIYFIDHSLAHAAYAYYSGCDDDRPRLVLTIDAFGDFVNYTARIIKRDTDENGNTCFSERLIASGPNFIIGRLYRYITLILGLKPNEHEYKVMGLAPYCKPIYFQGLLSKFRGMQRVNGCSFEDVKKPRDMYFSIRELLEGERFDAIAGALQAYTEELIVEWVRNCVKETGVTDVCIAGGIAMNVKANMLVSQLPELTSLSIPPSPDDSSQAMGAVYAYHHLQGLDGIRDVVPHPIGTPYLGRLPIEENDADEVYGRSEKMLSDLGFTIVRQDLNKAAARLIAEGRVLGRIVGREEFGARALGNRSILADPRNATIKKVINEKIKDRDFWMPFACSILEEHADKYVRLVSPASSYAYMTLCCESTPEGGGRAITAAVHPYDETCRPHVLSRASNPSYADLIQEFGALTGVYGVLNTSLNLHGSPIASTLPDAIHVLLQSDLDGLLTERFLAVKGA